jgi:hypothetical protein
MGDEVHNEQVANTNGQDNGASFSRAIRKRRGMRARCEVVSEKILAIRRQIASEVLEEVYSCNTLFGDTQEERVIPSTLSAKELLVLLADKIK